MAIVIDNDLIGIKMIDDPYVYPGTDVLKNSFEERNKVVLERIERTFTLAALYRLGKLPIEGNYDLDHLQRIHSAIFGGIYPEIAGRIRSIDLWKQEIVLSGQSVAYSHPNDIPEKAKQALKELNAGQYGDMTQRYQTEAFGKALAAVWQVHAFREGNTRVISLLAAQFSKQRGFELDRKVLSNTGSEFRDALAIACTYGELSDLTELLGKSRRSALASNHPVFGRLASEAVEVLRLMPDKDAKLARDGEHIKGTVLTTSYQTTLILTSAGVVGVPLKSFVVAPENNTRVDIVAKAGQEAGSKAALRYAKAAAFQAWRREYNILISLAAKGREAVATARRVMVDPNATPGEVHSKIGLVNGYAEAISKTWNAAINIRAAAIENEFRQKLPDLSLAEVGVGWDEVKAEFVLPRPVVECRDLIATLEYEARDHFKARQPEPTPISRDEDIIPHQNYNNMRRS